MLAAGRAPRIVVASRPRLARVSQAAESSDVRDHPGTPWRTTGTPANHAAHKTAPMASARAPRIRIVRRSTRAIDNALRFSRAPRRRYTTSGTPRWRPDEQIGANASILHFGPDSGPARSGTGGRAHAPQAWRSARRLLRRGLSASPRTAPARPGPTRAAARRRMLAATLLCLITASGAAAQTQAGWRYWAPADGIQESHSRKIGSAAGRRRHHPPRPGQERRRARRLRRRDRSPSRASAASPRRSWPASTPSPAATRGRSSEGVLKQLRGGQWTVRATPRPGEEMRSAMPIPPAASSCCSPSRVAAFDPARSTLDHADRRRGSRARRLPHDGPRLRRRALDRRARAASAASTAPHVADWTAYPAAGLDRLRLPAARRRTASCSPPPSTRARATRSRCGSPAAATSACSTRPRRCAPGAARTARCGCSKGRGPGA